uniref:C2H2-type domain-containing protein n=1 Tax=Brugia malayi TaxID=6279 RepID=A0A7I4K8J2_BRUMA
MFFTVSITPIIWFNLLLCIASDKNETFYPPNFGAADEIITNNTYSGVSDSFDYNNFEPLFSSEFLFDPSQFIDFAQVSGIEDISSKESNSETDLFTITPHPGFISPSYDDFIVHTNLESSLASNLDSLWRDANGELKTNDDKARYPSIRDTQSGTSSPLNVDTDDIITYMHLPGSQQNVVPIYFHQLTLSSDGTSGQHGNAELINMDNKHFSDNLNVPKYRGNTNEGSETNAQSGTSSPLNVDTNDIITYMHLPGSQQNVVPIYFHQLTLSSDGTSGQHGNAELINMDNKHFSDNLNVPKYRGNTNEGSETNAQSGTSSPLNVDTNDIITYMHLPGSQQNVVPIYFHQLTLSSDDTSGQHGNAEESNIDNTSMKDQKQVNEGSKTDNRKYICYYPGCTVIATNYNEYITHRKTHGQPLIYECKVPGCGRTFNHRTSFCSHIQTHQPKHQCKNCGKLFCRKNILQKHNKHCGTLLHERSYECVYRGCTMVTKDYNEYIAHRKAHGQPFIYECKVPGCGRTFDRKPSFYNHKQTHEYHHQCKCCGKFFSTKNGLQKHKKNCPTKFHKRGYECLYSGCAVISKSFNDNLKHKRTHNGPFIYECKVSGCGRTFNHESSLRDHKQTHEPRCQCEGCGKFFYRMSVLKLHKKSCSRAPR